MTASTGTTATIIAASTSTGITASTSTGINASTSTGITARTSAEAIGSIARKSKRNKIKSIMQF